MFAVALNQNVSVRYLYFLIENSQLLCLINSQMLAGAQFNFIGNSGFALALNSAIRLVPGSVAPMGPVCSSWVFLSRSSSGRSYIHPIGSEDERDWVRESNVMAARVALLALVTCAYQSTFIVEQPSSSLFCRSARWMWLVRLLKSLGKPVWVQHVTLGSYGGPTLKPLQLSSNNKAVLRKLYKPLSADDRARFASAHGKLVKRRISKSGKSQVTGQKHALRKSQRGAQVIKHGHIKPACFLIFC